MAGQQRPAGDFQHVARPGGDEGVLDVVRGGRDSDPRAGEGRDTGEAARRKNFLTAALNIEICGGESDDAEVEFENLIAYARESVVGDRLSTEA